MGFIDVFSEKYAELHEALLEVVDSLDAEGLNWFPYEGSNSVAVLVTHTLGNELETLRTVAGDPTARNRAAEFEVRDATPESLRKLIGQARAVHGDVAPRITPERLETLMVRPAASTDTPYSGLYHLVHSLSHAREHLGQAWVTRDLWRLRS
ncbi:MAG: hypothetical protein QOE92_845 [Chloroflexota bacterium]|nr:hypothetical protein [Chloroflexota bacterium]